MNLADLHEQQQLTDTLTANKMIEQKSFPPEYRTMLPYAWQEQIRILGIVFDPNFPFTAHVQAY